MQKCNRLGGLGVYASVMDTHTHTHTTHTHHTHTHTTATRENVKKEKMEPYQNFQ